MADQPGVTILKNLPKSTSRPATATMEQYRAMMADRPAKFNSAAVNYRDADSPDLRCSRCIHFFKNPASGRATCEVFRPDGDANVDPTYVCQFFTDGESFPLLNSSK